MSLMDTLINSLDHELTKAHRRIQAEPDPKERRKLADNWLKAWHDLDRAKRKHLLSRVVPPVAK